MEDLFGKDNNIGEKKILVHQFTTLTPHYVYGIDLFEGFEKLSAITYSSGISFMGKIIKKFNDVEIVFGYPPVLSKTQIRISSLQLNVLKTLVFSKDALEISNLMEQGIVKLYTSNDQKSHEKIYLLSGKNKKRLILGSANMSAAAFQGIQREVILYSDDSAAYDEMYKRFVELRDNCTSPVMPEKIKGFVENRIDPSTSIYNSPVIDEVRATGKTKELVETADENLDEDFLFEINENNFGNEKFDEFASKPKVSNGIKKAFITPDSVEKVIEKAEILTGTTLVNPSLDIDYKTKTICIGTYSFDLKPEPEKIRQAVDLVIRYFDGWKVVDDYAPRYRRVFWRMFIWYFSAPFIPYLRSVAQEHHRDINFKYPMFSILYGKSNCGKTKFLDFMTRLITGKPAYILEGKNVTCSKLALYKYNCKNLPLNIDEVSKSRFRSYSALIKEDTFGIKDRLRSYAPVVFITNEVESITMDLRKRCISMNLDSTISFDKTINNESFIKILDAAEGNNALFSEFASRMLREVDYLAELIIKREDSPDENILHSASVIMKNIFEEYHDIMPEYVRELFLIGDYFDAIEMGRPALEALELGLKVEPELFTFNEKENLLVYKNPDIRDKRQLENIKNDLPADWQAKISLGALSMDLTKAREYFKLKETADNIITVNPAINLIGVALKSEPEMFKIKGDFLVYKSQQGGIGRLEEIRRSLPNDWNATVTASNLVIPLKIAKENLDLSQISGNGFSVVPRFLSKITSVFFLKNRF